MVRVPAHERFNTYSHFFAMVMAAVGSGFLLSKAIKLQDFWAMSAFFVYAISTMAIFAISSIYHSLDGDLKDRWRQMDYMGIYLKIAGNYTPYTILFLSGRDLIIVLGLVWTLAFIGILKEYIFKSRKRNTALVLYVSMASTILLAMGHFSERVGIRNLAFIAAGYFCYAVGVIFFLNDHKWKYAHEIWHVFVMFGSFFHFLPLAFYFV